MAFLDIILWNFSAFLSPFSKGSRFNNNEKNRKDTVVESKVSLCNHLADLSASGNYCTFGSHFVEFVWHFAPVYQGFKVQS